MFSNIDEAIEWITGQRSNNYSFDHFREVCSTIGDPQNDFYTVHVAGTDGKGSTVNYLCSLLMSQGFKVGTFTSPHYVTHQDRIRVNGQNIPDDVFLDILNERYDWFVLNRLSMFEMDYLIMCDYFKREKVDFAIVEVGLGGRLDATNVVDNTKLSIITTIGFDHMDRLGDTLVEICREKCGIIKDDSKVLTGHLAEDCSATVEEEARKHHSKLYRLGEFTSLGDRSFIYEGEKYEILSYAAYQVHNACLALDAFRIISEDYPFEIDLDKAKKALKTSNWRCRFEIVKEEPRVILDGAHNIHGITALAESFDQFSGSKCIVFSALKRKEYLKMIEVLKQHCDRLVITTFENPEAIDLNDFKGYHTDPDYIHAIDEAMKGYENVLICGSLYFLSEVVLNCKF